MRNRKHSRGLTLLGEIWFVSIIIIIIMLNSVRYDFEKYASGDEFSIRILDFIDRYAYCTFDTTDVC